MPFAILRLFRRAKQVPAYKKRIAERRCKYKKNEQRKEKKMKGKDWNKHKKMTHILAMILKP